MKIIGTGLGGLVGSRIVSLLSPTHTFENISRSTGIDITNQQMLTDYIQQSDAEIVLHLAAKADVDGCEKDKEQDIAYKDTPSMLSKESAWNVNVIGTENIVAACNTSGKRLIFISTDFVFDGTKEYYTEQDNPQPINWYGKTKYEGELRVQQATCPWMILRIAYPYRGEFSKNDFFRAILQRLEQRQEIQAVTDHIFTPTFVDDIAYGIDVLISRWQNGVVHLTGSQSLTPYEAAIQIAKTYGKDASVIVPTTRDVFFKNRAPRPFQLAMRSDKIVQFGIEMRSFEKGIKTIQEQSLV